MRRTSLGLLGALALMLLAPPFTAHAETQNGGAGLILDPEGIRAPYAIAPQPDSGALVLAIDSRNGGLELYAQRVDRRGAPLLGQGGKLVQALAQGTSIHACADGSGGIVYAYSLQRGVTGFDIVVQRVLADGSTVFAGSGLVVCAATSDQTNPKVAPGTGSTFWVGWSDARANVANVSDLYVQRVGFTGTLSFLANGLAVNNSAFRTYRGAPFEMKADLLGGALFAWPLSAGGVRTQRMSSAGTLQFAATGSVLGDVSDSYAQIAADGSGGLWAGTVRSAGADYTAYGHHLNSAGTSVFAAAGIALRPATIGNSVSVMPVRTNAGGCCFYIAPNWNPPSLGGSLYLQEISSIGTLLRGAGGTLLTYSCADFRIEESTSAYAFAISGWEGSIGPRLRLQRIGYDGTSLYPGLGKLVGRSELQPAAGYYAIGLLNSTLPFAAFSDLRYSFPKSAYELHLFGQGLDSAGNPLWTDAENPVLASAKDAPQDQGGHVRIAWDAGLGDQAASQAVRGYRGWRALNNVPASLARATALRPADGEPFSVGETRYVYQANLYWEQVGQMNAVQLPSYALTLPTGQDSVAGGSADESFMVEAYDDSSHHWWSNVLVAHSVDNLAPAAPAPLTGQFAAGTTRLHWNRNTEADLAGYRLYRGTSVSFVPGPSNFVAELPDTGAADTAGAPYVYKLTARDVHGNESPAATLVPAGALDVGGPARALAFSLASRNPAHGGASLRMTLPVAADVRVTVYDAAGRGVRTLANGAREAGEWTLEWDGRGDAGQALPSGLYFAKLEGAGELRAVRIVLTR